MILSQVATLKICVYFHPVVGYHKYVGLLSTWLYVYSLVVVRCDAELCWWLWREQGENKTFLRHQRTFPGEMCCQLQKWHFYINKTIHKFSQLQNILKIVMVLIVARNQLKMERLKMDPIWLWDIDDDVFIVIIQWTPFCVIHTAVIPSCHLLAWCETFSHWNTVGLIICVWYPKSLLFMSN